MKRLTYEHEGKMCVSGLNGAIVSDKYANYWGEAVECLAAYEDAESEGRLVVLPCKVGDMVYVDPDTWFYSGFCYENRFIHSKHFLVGEIVSVIKTKKQLLIKIRVSNSIHSRYRHKRYPSGAIGKTVFLTREEAEEALRRNEG